MTKRQFLLVLLFTAVFAFMGSAFFSGIFHGTPVHAQKVFPGNSHYELPEGNFLGTVEKGRLNMIYPHRPLAVPIRLTAIGMQEARPAESGEIDLKKFEGKVIMFTGHDGGAWIYKASVIDKGGPILSTLVKKVFGKPKVSLFRH